MQSIDPDKKEQQVFYVYLVVPRQYAIYTRYEHNCSNWQHFNV